MDWLQGDQLRKAPRSWTTSRPFEPTSSPPSGRKKVEDLTAEDIEPFNAD
jgi:hypothetical protein